MYPLVQLSILATRRETLEKVDAAQDTAKLCPKGSAEHLEARETYWIEKAKEKKETLALWNQIMSLLVSIETHGSKKLEDETWEHFIQQGLQCEVPELPGPFKVNASLPFPEVIVQITSRIGELQNEVKDAERKSKGVRQRKDQKVRTLERQEKRGTKKVEAILQADDKKPEQLNLGNSSGRGLGVRVQVTKRSTKSTKNVRIENLKVPYSRIEPMSMLV